MKHAGPKALDRIKPLLERLRSFAELKEKSRGCFYLAGRGFLHFHEHGFDELYADIRNEDDFDRLPATTATQQKVVLQRTKKALAEAKAAHKR